MRGTNPGSMEKLSYLVPYAVHLVLITWIFEPVSAVLPFVLQKQILNL